MKESLLRESMCEIGAMLWQRGLLGATEGNLSVRFGEGKFLCTPSGLSKGHLRPDQLLVIDEQANVLRTSADRLGFRESENKITLKPSSEILMHLGLYKERPDAQAIIHAHPITATGFAYAGETIPTDISPEGLMVLGPVAYVPFGMPGTQELPDAIQPFAKKHKTFLLANHGAVALGLDLNDAYNRMETLERLAKIILVARLIDRPKELPERDSLRLRSLAVSLDL